MKKIEKPNFSISDVIDTFYTVKKTPISIKLHENKCDFVNLELKYSSMFEKGSINQIGELVIDKFSSKQLKDMYTNRFADANSSGRKYYNRIIVRQGICPFCGVQISDTLDHYLPKSTYSSCSILPINLVPCCSRCNFYMRDTFDLQIRPIHLYYDDIDVYNWLGVRINQTNPVSVNYFINHEMGCDDIMKQRIINQVNLLRILDIYNVNGTNEYREISDDINKMHWSVDSVKEFLSSHYETCRRRYGNNDFRTILYKTLVSDEWFCNGGYNNIGE